MNNTPKYDLEIYQGAGKTVTFTLTDNNGTAVDVTNYTAKLQIRSKPGGVIYSSLTNTSGITINGASGEFVVAWTGAQTADFNFDKAAYDLFVTPSGGQPTCLVYGDVMLIKRVSQ